VARHVSIFFGLGLLWLFLFAMPVGKGKSLYEVLHYYVVDTRPVHWVVGKIQGGYDVTLDKADVAGGAANDTMTLQGRETLSQSSEMLKAIE